MKGHCLGEEYFRQWEQQGESLEVGTYQGKSLVCSRNKVSPVAREQEGREENSSSTGRKKKMVGLCRPQ